MNAMRPIPIAAAVLVWAAAPTTAEPSKPQAPHREESQRSAEIVLASAATAQQPGLATTRPAPAKRRVGRVTTCRCGDPQAAPETQEQ